MMRRAQFVLCAMFLGLAAAACGSGDDSADATASSGAVSGNVTVYAAASLTDVFNEAGKAFEAKHPGTKVQFNFGSSAALATQINEGAPADVFAAANTAQMKVVTDKRNAGEPKEFAINGLVIVAAKGDSRVQSLQDLAKPGLKLVLAAKEVPAGQYAREVLQKAATSYGTSFPQQVQANVKSEEPNVRSVLTKVELGEADAGIVYATDVAAAAGVRTVQVPAEFNVVAEYPIAVLTGAKNRGAADAFVQFVLSPEGQGILAKHGFGAPQ